MVLAKFQMLSSYVWLMTAVLNLVTLSKQPVGAFGYPFYRKSVCFLKTFPGHYNWSKLWQFKNPIYLLFHSFYRQEVQKKKIKPTNQLIDKKGLPSLKSDEVTKSSTM